MSHENRKALLCAPSSRICLYVPTSFWPPLSLPQPAEQALAMSEILFPRLSAGQTSWQRAASGLQPHHQGWRWRHLLFRQWCLTSWLRKSWLKNNVLPFLFALQWPRADPALQQVIHHQQPERCVSCKHKNTSYSLYFLCLPFSLPIYSNVPHYLSFKLIIIDIYRPPNSFLLTKDHFVQYCHISFKDHQILKKINTMNSHFSLCHSQPFISWFFGLHATKCTCAFVTLFVNSVFTIFW